MKAPVSHIELTNFEVAYRARKSGIILRIPQLSIERGEIIGVYGPNHVGKTTFLKAIGQIHSDLKLINEEGVKYNGAIFSSEDSKPVIMFVPQDYSSSILPWYSVRDNLTILMKALKLSDDEIEAKVLSFSNSFYKGSESEMMVHYGLRPSKSQSKKVSELSGGQKQILTVLRALAVEPDIIMMDEPFSALDSYKGSQFRRDVFNFLRSRKVTTFVITHSLEELIELTDKIVFFNHSTDGEKLRGIEEISEADKKSVEECAQRLRAIYEKS